MYKTKKFRKKFSEYPIFDCGRLPKNLLLNSLAVLGVDTVCPKFAREKVSWKAKRTIEVKMTRGLDEDKVCNSVPYPSV